MEQEHVGVEELDLWGLHFEFHDTNSGEYLKNGYPSRWIISVDGQELGKTYSNATPGSIKFMKETLKRTGVLILNKANLVWSEGSPLPVLIRDNNRGAEISFESMEEVAIYLSDNYLVFEGLPSYKGRREDF